MLAAQAVGAVTGARGMPLVKVISKTGVLQRQVPADGCWGGCRFTFAREERGYDWLVVYDDIPPFNRLGKVSCEALACSPDNAILVTHEPAAVKIHGRDFCGQFSHVLTCHEPWALRHAGRVDMQPLSPWWYGMHLPGARQMTYDDLAAMAPWEKSRDLVVTCSDKQQTHTLHSKRFAFTRALAGRLPQMDWFGHGVRPFGDKSEVLHDYKYHIVVENHVCAHYWTEKLADAFLGYCLPFYYGCPNAAAYFPADSFIAIDVEDAEKSARIIADAIANDEYSRRLPSICEARRRLLDEHNFFAVISRFIAGRPGAVARAADGRTIYSRRALQMRSPAVAGRYFVEKWRARRRFWGMYR